MENDSHLDYYTKNPAIIEIKDLLLEQHCHCVNNHDAPKINEHDNCKETLELILKYCTILDYNYRPSKNNNNDKRLSYSIRKIINDKKRDGKPCTCFKDDKIDLLRLAIRCNTDGIKKLLIPKFSTVQDRENRKNMESLKELQIRELLCHCKNQKNDSYGVLIQILIHINDINNKYQKLKATKKNYIFKQNLNKKIILIFKDVNIERKLNGLKCNYQALGRELDGSKMVKKLEKKINTLNKNIKTKNKNLQNFLGINKIILLKHCNCFIEKGFFSITKLPFKINMSNPEGKVILRKLLKYMKHNVLSTIDLINFLGLGPNVILPTTFSLSRHYEKDKRKKEFRRTSIFGHAIRIIYKESLIELYNIHFNTLSFLDRSTSYTKLNRWESYTDKNNKEVVNIINKDHLAILEKLYDMSKFDENFEFYKKQHSKGKSWLQTKIEYFDPKDTLPEIIKGLNTKLHSEMSLYSIGKLKAILDSRKKTCTSWLRVNLLCTHIVLEKLGADFITIIEQKMDPYNLKNQPNIPPPFDKAKYIEQLFSQKS